MPAAVGLFCSRVDSFASIAGLFCLDSWYLLTLCIPQHCHLVSVGGGDAREGAAVIRRQHVQVLIDLNGWTAGHRSDILHQRAAPIQALYLGPNSQKLVYSDFIQYTY